MVIVLSCHLSLKLLKVAQRKHKLIKAGLWEIVEWLYAVIDGGEAGAAFLGSQGDEWDAQKDILCDTFGAVCSVSLFLLFNCNSRSAATESRDDNEKRKVSDL